jgi:hypothetical protein
MPTPTYEHIVATAHRINGEPVTVDTDLSFLDEHIDRDGAHAYNNDLLSRDDFFTVDGIFSDDVFDFRELEDSQDSVSTICIFFKKK